MFKFFLKIFNKNNNYNNFVINNKAVITALEAETQRRLKNFEQALILINEAIEQEPKNDMYYVTKSLIFFDTNQYKSALNEINKAIKINNKVQRYKKLQQKILDSLN